MKHYRFKITVRGNGYFPVDMLRYDHCWPRTEADSHMIDANYLSDSNKPMLRDVQLLADHDRKFWEPTADRWRSFNWSVVGCEIVT